MKECIVDHSSLLNKFHTKEINEIKSRIEISNLSTTFACNFDSKAKFHIGNDDVCNENVKFSEEYYMCQESERCDNKIKYNRLQEKITKLEIDQKKVKGEINRMTKANEMLKSENDLLKETLKEFKSIYQGLYKMLTSTQVSLLALEERIINQEKMSAHGCLLWKITNVHERMQEAKSDGQTSFYSPPFFTNSDGYKMCAKIYLNGDGNGRNSHLSLFLVILPGENDALLTWPFRQKVTFTLMDQSETKENVVDAFRPDPNSTSFKRPMSEKNKGSGCPQFCSLDILNSNEYIKENAMFIKIDTDCEYVSYTNDLQAHYDDGEKLKISIEESDIKSVNLDSSKIFSS